MWCEVPVVENQKLWETMAPFAESVRMKGQGAV